MTEEIDGTGGTPGVSRRDMLRKSAIVGGALVWTAPAVQSLAGPAFAQTAGSPGGQENCVYYAISILPTGCSSVAGSVAPGDTACLRNNELALFNSAQDGGCAFFLGLTQMNGQWVVRLDASVTASSVRGFSKCGSDGCQPIASAVDGTTATGDTLVFVPCATSGPNGQAQGISNVQIVFCVPRT